MRMRRHIRERMTHQEQVSEALVLSLFLAFSGGLQDAYTYMIRDHVFANGQTGNVVLMSAGLMEGNWKMGLRYLVPVLAFAAGIFLAEIIGNRYKWARLLHWRQGVLLVEIGLMAGVGLLSQEYNLLANCMVSFACALQVQTFRKVCGHAYASTMCIGNLRSGTEAVSVYLRHRRQEDKDRAGYYFSVIAVFAVGAGMGGLLSGYFQERTIWISCGVLLLCFLLMELDRLEQEAKDYKE